MQKIYFDTKEERDAFNAAEAEYRGMNMVNTVFWYGWGEDENGHFIEVDDWE